MVKLDTMLLQLGVLISAALITTSIATAAANSYPDQVTQLSVPATSCSIVTHKLKANTNYEIRISNVTLPALGLQCSPDDLLLSKELVSTAVCQSLTNGTCVQNYSKTQNSCSLELQRQNNNTATSLLPLDNNQQYDSTLWAPRRSCTNGDGFLFAVNTCARPIMLVLTFSEADSAQSTKCATVINLNRKKGISRTNLIVAIVVPIGVTILFLLALLLCWGRHYMATKQRQRENRYQEPVAPVQALPVVQRGNTATMSAASVAAEDAPGATQPSVPTAYVATDTVKK